jgi:hypothetical protein
MRTDWLMPLTGVIFVVLLIVSFAVGGEPPDVEDPVSEIVDHYVDNKDAIVFSIILGGLATAFFIFYANYLRRHFGGATLAATVLVGASIMAVGFTIDATIALALAESVEDIDDSAVQALQGLWDNDFIPIAFGVLIFLISAGVSTLQTGVLPRWMGWVALALAVIGFTPVGWAAFLGGGLWVIVSSVLLSLRARREDAVAPPPATAG